MSFCLSASARSIFAITLLFGITANAQEWLFRQFDQSSHLVDIRVSDVTEDTSGRIWVATWGVGVIVIDEAVFKAYTIEDGLPSDWTVGVTSTPDGAIWVSSPDGITRISDQGLSTFTTANTPILPSNEVWCLTLLNDGRMAAGVGKGFVHSFDPANPAQSWLELATPEILGDIEIHDIVQTPDGTLWGAARYEGLWRMSPGAAWEKASPPSGLTARTDGLFLSQRGALYAFGGNRVAVYEEAEWHEIPALKANVRGMNEDKEGSIFAGTDLGLFRYRTLRGWQLLSMGRNLGIPYIRGLHFDDRNMLWLACDEGLLQGIRPVWSSFRASSNGNLLELPGLTSSVTQAPYAFDKKGYLVQFQDGAWNAVAHFPGLTPTRLHLSRHDPNILWVLTTPALLKIDLTTFSVIERNPVLPQMEPDELFEMQDGTICLITLTGLYTFENGDWQVLPRNNEGTRGMRLTGIAQVSDGSIYLATETEAYRWIGDDLVLLGDTYPELIGQHFLDVLATREGEIWLATSGEGIFVLGEEGITRHTRESGLPSDRIARMFQDSSGAIWVCSRRKGTSSYSNGRWIHFERKHGLPNGNAEDYGEYPAGVIWFSTLDSGIYRYEPDTDSPVTFILSSPEEISYQQNGMVWLSGRDAWGLTPQEELMYSWRLVPETQASTDTGWSKYTHQAVAVIAPQEPGNYVFQARASDLDRNIDMSPAMVKLRVTPPIWRTPAFLIPTGILGTIAFIALIAWARVLKAERQAKRDLQRSMVSLENAQRVAHLGNWEWDVSAGTLHWSTEIYRIFGLDPAVVPPTPAGFLRAVHPEERAMVDDAFVRAVSNHVPPDFDHRIERPNGEIRYVHQMGELVLDGEGRVVRVFGTLADITDRKLSEEEREKLIVELKQALKEVRTLSGLLPICAKCKNVRDDTGYWQQIESYVRDRSYAEFSHSICPDCAELLYGDRKLGEHR